MRHKNVPCRQNTELLMNSVDADCHHSIPRG